MLNTEAIKINDFIFLQNKAIQCVPVSTFFLGKLSLELTPLNLDSLS